MTAAAIVLSMSSWGANATTFGALYAFGDSLNDCCFSGPFTNGTETWLPELADGIGATYTESAGQNLAVGGAQSGSFNAIPLTDAGFGFNTGLQSQVLRFKQSGPAVGGDDIAVVWVGTNDIWPSAFAEPEIVGLPILQPLGARPSAEAVGSLWAATSGARSAHFETQGSKTR